MQKKTLVLVGEDSGQVLVGISLKLRDNLHMLDEQPVERAYAPQWFSRPNLVILKISARSAIVCTSYQSDCCRINYQRAS